MNFEFVSHYKNNEALRASFNRLAVRVFDLSFEDWYIRGLWNNTYECYSYICNGEIVANVSTSRMEITRNGNRCDAVQIGTVMTAPEFRKMGLAASLMRRVINECEKKCEFIYLFANPTAVNFYPKFGFKTCEEYVFTGKRQTQQGSSKQEPRRLNLSDTADFQLLSTLSQGRRPVSQTLGVKSDMAFMFNCLYGFSDNIYYLENLAAAIIFKIGLNTLDIYDIISKDEIRIGDIIGLLPASGNVRLHFTPDELGMYIPHPKGNEECPLFVRPGNALGSGKFIFPETSHT